MATVCDKVKTKDFAFGADMDNQICDAEVTQCSSSCVLEEGHNLTLAPWMLHLSLSGLMSRCH